MGKSLSLRVRLAVLVAGTMLPLIGFAAATIYQHFLQDQREAFGRVLQFTRGIQLVLDREMQGIVSGLTVLANSETLTHGNFAGFGERARTFLQEFPGAPSISVGDRDGDQLYNTSRAVGTPLPRRTERPGRLSVFDTRKPVFSPLFIGSVSKMPIVTVTVPVIRNGKVIYDLSFDPPLEIFQRIIEQQKPGDDWTVSIFDQTGVNFARVPDPTRTVGQRASPTLYAVMFSAKEGQARTVSLENVPLLTAFARSDISGWIAAAGIAQSTLTAPALRTFVLTAVIGTLLLIIGLAFAIRMAAQVLRAETLHNLLIDELNHRVKNTLATVQSLSSQTFRSSSDDEAREKFGGRLASLGRAHNILSAQKWEGADIGDVVADAISPFEVQAARRVRIHGPAAWLSARSAVMLSMVLHELATNAAKYGALSTPAGSVSVTWQAASSANDTHLTLTWRETGGPEVAKPDRSGFGTTLIERGFAEQVGGEAALSFEPGGISCTLKFAAG